MTTKEMLEKDDSFKTKMLADSVKALIATGVKNDNLTDLIAVLDELLASSLRESRSLAGIATTLIRTRAICTNLIANIARSSVSRNVIPTLK